MTRIEPSAGPHRSVRGAWWIAVFAVLFFVAVAFLQVGEVRRSREEVAIGDGKDPATYGFDLASLTVSARWLAAAMPRDGLATLDYPELLTAAGVDSLNRAERGKYLVGEDLVIGVEHAGTARAYPLRVLNWHEVANDTVNGVPVAVAWHPLSGSAVVLDRRIWDRVLTLGLSGLVWNSHHLLYDRSSAAAGGGTNGLPEEHSLWVPLLAKAVAGPAAGDTLAILPAALVAWRAWRAAYPATTVPLPKPAMRRAYKRDPYGSYQSGDVLRYPVAPLPPPAPGQRLKELLPDRAAPRDGLSFARAHAFRFAWQALSYAD